AARHLSNEADVAPDNTEMIQLLAERDVPFVIMHALAAPATMQASPVYDDVVRDVGAFFEQRAAALERFGIATRERMIVDPGIGFGKTLDHNLALIRECASYSSRWPVLLGPSRKRFIGDILAKSADDHPAIANAEARLMGTAASVAHAALSRVEMVRVHDVLAMRDVVDVCARLIQRRETGPPGLPE
ncbi:MAG: dihydropteroate synthase, partial [Phycisphaerales bacterium]|nr:dihydropteroate synthase [Phycisphaerales bacterium]